MHGGSVRISKKVALGTQEGAPRRTHRKSKLGCKDCKQRRIKCDESRPSCINCIKTRRNCSYLSTAAVLPSPPSVPEPRVDLSTSTSSSSTSSSPSSHQQWHHLPACLPSPSDFSDKPPPRYPTGECYSLCHLELLYHFLNEMCQTMHGDQLIAKAYSELAVKLAFKAPYLMSELLAIAAAHKSTTLQGDCQDFYCQEATKLQTRALTQFNSIQTRIKDEDSLSIFTFSAVLGQHVLFDTFSSQADLSTVLDRFAHCLHLHRGIRTIVGQLFSSIRSQLQHHSHIGSAFAQDIEPIGPRSDLGDDCAVLTELLQRSELGFAENKAYADAVDVLQQMFDNQRDLNLSSYRRVNVVQEWPVRLSTDYVNFLTQRRPEALVILAYYGMLLHNARFHWAFADAGRFLIRSITLHLGSYWAEWLDKPNQVLEAS